MKKVFFSICLLALSITTYSQAIMPTMVVFPDNRWMKGNNYAKEIDNNGQTQLVPDYASAFNNDAYLNGAILTFNGLLKDRGYDVADLKSALGDLDQQMADAMTENHEMADPADILAMSVQPDIRINLDYGVSQSLGPRCAYNILVGAVDAYTNEPIADINANSDISSETIDLVLKKALSGKFDEFSTKCTNYYLDLRENGRKVNVIFSVKSGSSINFQETELNGDPLDEYLEDWVMERSYKKQARVQGRASAHRLSFIIRIPFFEEGTDTPLSTKRWARALRKDIQSIGLTAKVMERGLGRVEIILGD